MAKELTKSEKINMDIADIAKAVRKDIKNEFGNKIKCSVRSKRFAGGTSLSVELKKCSIDLIKSEEEFDEEYMDYRLTNPDLFKRLKLRYHRNEILAVKEEVTQKINEIVDAYNFDESDYMIDYYCVNFYYHGVSGNDIEVI